MNIETQKIELTKMVLETNKPALLESIKKKFPNSPSLIFGKHSLRNKKKKSRTVL